MMKAGIVVEPIIMREWIEMMHETQEDATNHLASVWIENNMDMYVFLSRNCSVMI